MGYDYYWVNEPSAELRAAYDKARKAFDLAVTNRDNIDPSDQGTIGLDLKPTGGTDRWIAAHDAVTAAYHAISEASVWSFRLNIVGGSRYAQAMVDLDMMGNGACPAFPDDDAFPALRNLPDEVDRWEINDLLENHPNLAEAITDPAMRMLSALLTKMDHMTPNAQSAVRAHAEPIIAGYRSRQPDRVRTVVDTTAESTTPKSTAAIAPSEQLRSELFTAITGATVDEHSAATWRYLIDHPEIAAAAQKYRKAEDDVLRFSPSSDRMWYHKIAGSNDGWINTPEEITSALHTYRKTNPDTIARVLDTHDIERDYWDRWIRFLDRAATEGGGFTTY